MDTLDHRRRRPSAGPDRTGESEEKVPQVGVTQTALSPQKQGHGDPMGRVTTESVETPRMRAQGVQLSVSPGAMEQGLVASPFHSELVQSEVALSLSRPSTLDADALTLAGQREARDAAPVREFEWPEWKGVWTVRNRWLEVGDLERWGPAVTWQGGGHRSHLRRWASWPW